jgi:hypothetical protein
VVVQIDHSIRLYEAALQTSHTPPNSPNLEAVKRRRRQLLCSAIFGMHTPKRPYSFRLFALRLMDDSHRAK